MKLRIGSRESALAIAQTKIVIDAIKKFDREIEIELVTMKTTGDVHLDTSIDKIGGKGLFTKELEAALQDGRIDLCVHSYKDMPSEISEDLPIVALSKRERANDVLILPEGVSEYDYSKPIGASSKRRNVQMQFLDNRASFALVRGNVLTRLKKLDSGQYGALILAYAGLERLNLTHRISKVFTTDEILPAASQGILAVQGRAGEDYSYLSEFNSVESQIISKAERAFLKEIGGGCSSPNTAYAYIENDMITATGIYFDNERAEMRKAVNTGAFEDAEQIGISLAKTVKGGASLE